MSTKHIAAMLMLLWLFPQPSSSKDIQEVIVKPGGNMTLQCHAPREAAIGVVEWKRADEKSQDYVFFVRDNLSVESFQLPSYRGRVALREPNMEEGDVSVILRNVSNNDTGTYKCSIVAGNGAQLISTIKLKVEDSDRTAGNGEGANEARGIKNGGNKDGYGKVLIGALSIVCCFFGT